MFVVMLHPLNRCCVQAQRVDLEHHTWANYFLAAYKVQPLLLLSCDHTLFKSPFLAVLCIGCDYSKPMLCFGFQQGVFEYLEKQGKAPTPVGLQVMLHGQVPTGEPPLPASHHP